MKKHIQLILVFVLLSSTTLFSQNTNEDSDKIFIEVSRLKDWVIQLKAQNSDSIFNIKMDGLFKKLNKVDENNTKTTMVSVHKIEFDILKEINELNSRKDNKSNPGQYWQRANDFYNQGNYGSAIKNYNIVLHILPSFTEAYLLRGQSYFNMKYYEEAIKDLSMYILFEPEKSVGYYTRGWCYYYQNKPMKCLLDFMMLVELDPKSAMTYYCTGSAKSILKDYSGAIIDYQRSIKLVPNFSMAYNNIAWAKFEQGKYKEALPIVNKAIELDPSNQVAYDSRAEIKLYLNDNQGCIIDANKAIELDPKVANPYLVKGRALYRLGKKDNVCNLWRKAGELGSEKAFEFILKYCND